MTRGFGGMLMIDVAGGEQGGKIVCEVYSPATPSPPKKKRKKKEKKKRNKERKKKCVSQITRVLLVYHKSNWDSCHDYI